MAFWNFLYSRVRNSYFKTFLYIPDNTGKWVSGIVLSRTEMNFDFLYHRINIKKTTVIYCEIKGKIDLFSHHVKLEI